MISGESRLYQIARRGLHWLSNRALPVKQGELHLPGLNSRVEVLRDPWGAAHIYAENETDLFFAQGFVHAQERLWQMEFQRRLVAGRLSEILGSPALEADRWTRVLGLYRLAEKEAGALHEEEHAILDAYSRGVNTFLARSRLPVEFSLLRARPEPWSIADSLAWSKMMAWMLSGNWQCELLRRELEERLGPLRASQLELAADHSWPVILQITDALGLEQQMAALSRSWAGAGAREGAGSNSWVVAGSRTASGMPILANDMHLMLTAPSVWFENHLSAGSYHATGVSLPGLPLVISGHNGRVAWGFTTAYADVQDLFEERLRQSPDGRLEYEFQGDWKPVSLREEIIRVRGAAARVEQVFSTHHGPLLHEMIGKRDGPPLALAWSAYHSGGGTFRALARMNRAGDCCEFREALRGWNIPVQNVVYADTQGNIAYTQAGKVPIRRRGQGRVPVPGWTGEYEWDGSIPFDELPHLCNPPAGYIVTANNRVAGPDFPYWLGWDYVSGDRAERITELILQREQIDLADIQRMQMDQVSPSAQTMASVIGAQHSDDPVQREIIRRMRGWDGGLRPDSPEAAIYEVFTRQMIKILFEDRLGDLFPRFAGSGRNPIEGFSLWGHHSWEWLRREILQPDSAWFDLGEGETKAGILRLALRRTVDFLVENRGPDLYEWGWGKFHALTFQHQLERVRQLGEFFNLGPFPIGGDGNTIWAATGLFDRVDSPDGMVGPPFRFIADLSNLDASLGLHAPGNSGHPADPHYSDQVENWFAGAYHPMLYSRDQVLQAQESCLVLLPATL